MNVFEVVKENVTARQAAEAYGLKVGRTGMACCPFHSDKSPSMKLDERYYCFGCGATGDAVDLTAKLFGIGLREAAVKLAEDFGLNYHAPRCHERCRAGTHHPEKSHRGTNCPQAKLQAQAHPKRAGAGHLHGGHPAGRSLVRVLLHRADDRPAAG